MSYSLYNLKVNLSGLLMNLHFKFFNLLSFISTIIINVLTINGFGPFKSITNISNEYNTLITPPNWAFSIWGLIYLGLLIFIFCQFGKTNIINNLIDKIGYKFIFSCLFNILWLVCFCYGNKISITISVLMITSLLISLFLIQKKCGFFVNYFNFTELFGFAIPFSLYLGWITTATLVNIATVIDVYFDISSNLYIYTILLFISLMLFSINLLIYNNFVTSFVYLYVLASLLIKNYNSVFLIGITSTVSLIFIFMIIVKCISVNYSRKVQSAILTT